MTAATPVADRRSAPPAGPLLVTGFAAAVAARTVIGGPGASRSGTAGLVFAGCLTVLALAAGTGLRAGRPAVAIPAGLATAALLCLPGAFGHLLAPGVRPQGNFAGWASIVGVVAVAEEVFLRGALYAVVRSRRGETAALVVTAVAFAALHLPLYGWGSVPLDLAVGLVLGVLREQTGGWLAPAVAHVGADLAAWFLR